MNIAELYGNKQIAAFVNLNAIIYVKLNETGLKVNDNMSDLYKLKVIDGVYVKTQLWRFIQTFAPHLVTGTTVIEGNTMIILPDEGLLKVKTFAQIEEEFGDGTESRK